MKRHGGTLSTYYQVKEANLKGLHIVWFQLYDILEKARLWRQIRGCQELGVGGRGEQAEHRGFLGHGNYSVWYYNGGYMSLYVCQNP